MYIIPRTNYRLISGCYEVLHNAMEWTNVAMQWYVVC